MSKFREAKRRGLKAIFSKALPDRLFISSKFIPANDPCFTFHLVVIFIYSNSCSCAVHNYARTHSFFFQADKDRFCTIAVRQGVHNT